jgi:bacterioferritin
MKSSASRSQRSSAISSFSTRKYSPGKVAAMKGNADVVALLNDLLTHELTAVNQYLGHAKSCENWGYGRLAVRLHAQSIDERQHADLLIARILFLEGTPDLQRYETVQTGQTVREQLEHDLRLEHAAIAMLDGGIEKCRARGDNASEDLLTRILVSEQEDTHWLESQLELIRQIGEQNYLAQQINA